MLANLPLYLAFIGTSVGLLLVAIVIYKAITPFDELRLIRAGNRAAAISLGGTGIGLALTLHAIGSATWSVLDLAVWGAIALVVQLLTYALVATLLVGLGQRARIKEAIEADRVGYGILLGAAAIIVGILNAAALSV